MDQEPAGGGGFKKGYDPRRYVAKKATPSEATAPTPPTPPTIAPPRRADAPLPDPTPPMHRVTEQRTPENDQLLPGPRPRDPMRAVRLAQDRLRRKALKHARYLDELTEPVRPASPSHPPCPACGCGMPRPEDIRLRAISAAGAAAGWATTKQGEQGADSGPAIVLPPGTRIAIAAVAPPAVEQGVAREPVRELRLTRGDEYGEPSGAPSSEQGAE